MLTYSLVGLEVRGLPKKTRWGTEGSPSVSLYNQRYNLYIKMHVPTGGRMPTMKKC
jgi:hypothetical protein